MYAPFHLANTNACSSANPAPNKQSTAHCTLYLMQLKCILDRIDPHFSISCDDVPPWHSTITEWSTTHNSDHNPILDGHGDVPWEACPSNGRSCRRESSSHCMVSLWQAFNSPQNPSLCEGNSPNMLQTTDRLMMVDDSRWLMFIDESSLINKPMWVWLSRSYSLKWVASFITTHTFNLSPNKHTRFSVDRTPSDFIQPCQMPPCVLDFSNPDHLNLRRNHNRAHTCKNTKKTRGMMLWGQHENLWESLNTMIDDDVKKFTKHHKTASWASSCWLMSKPQ